jgi:hypothetical protein
MKTDYDSHSKNPPDAFLLLRGQFCDGNNVQRKLKLAHNTPLNLSFGICSCFGTAQPLIPRSATLCALDTDSISNSATSFADVDASLQVSEPPLAGNEDHCPQQQKPAEYVKSDIHHKISGEAA